MMNSRLFRRFAKIHSKYCIIGAGGGGLSLAARLSKSKHVKPEEISILDNSPYHYYKSGWSLAAIGKFNPAKTRRNMADVIPKGVNWVQSNVVELEPKNNSICLKNGDIFTYDQLIIASGITYRWDMIEGALEALQDDNRPVCSVYFFEKIDKMRKLMELKTIKESVFTQPIDPISCGGAPQKICYSFSDHWRKNHLHVEKHFYSPNATIFPVPFYATSLQKIADGYNIDCHFSHNLIKITKDNVAVFENVKTKEIVNKPFDFLHFAPPMTGGDYLTGSGLANEKNFVNVDKHTLQHLEFKNVWALGDTASTPNSKTLAAAVDQVDTVLKNLIAWEVFGQDPAAKYRGYSACALLTGDNKVLLAEFKYDLKLSPTFYSDQREPRREFYWLFRYFMPFVCLHFTSSGYWKGRRTFFDRDLQNYDYLENESFQQK